MTKNENILLTGLTGYVGGNFIKVLLEDSRTKNNKVYALVREKSSHSEFIKGLIEKYKNFNLIVGDFVDLQSSVTSQSKCIEFLKSIISNNEINVVIHLASMMEFYPQNSIDFSNIHKTNVIGTENLLKACTTTTILNTSPKMNSVNSNSNNSNNNNNNNNNNNSSCIRRFIYCSTTETMGGKKLVTGIPLSELDDPYSHPSYYYGETKRLAEDHVRRYEKKYGLDTIILRPTGIFGKDDQFSIFELIQSVSYGILFFIPSFANGNIMYIHVDDFVQSIMLSIHKEKLATDDTDGLPHTYIISPDKGLTYKEAIIFLNEKLNRMKPRLKLPASICFPAIRVLGFFMYLFSSRKPFLFKAETLAAMEEDRIYSNERAKRELGFKPQYTFKQGLNVTIEEYLENERIGFYSVSPLFIFTTIVLLIIKFLIL
ncbi:hypothetical protein RB653_005175 [Dictyostelium firmibasis]|uniref:NAD-dependent epimerase/dehydratase domain-containing protein n=1 Tax=Dictyostelium firmibasis TaxID=79012 RepID=A0AAN7UKL2_9MYCE